MQGLMQDWPLLVHTILDHASRWHGKRAVVTRSVEGPIHRTTWREVDRRSRALADAAGKRLGVRLGEVVGTMAWNTVRHLETWYGLMGRGAVVHTLNPRLFADQLVYIVNHAEDRWIFLDLSFVPALEAIQDRLPAVKGFIVMTDRAHMPEGARLRNPICYEELLPEGDPGFAWPRFDENTACGMCYTSGTTGDPKGVVYSHRSNVLHALTVNGGDALGFSSRDTVMPVVPMFHANAWALAFSTPMAGAALVLPGAKMDGASLYELLDAEKVTFAAAVPTIWLMLLQFLEQNPEKKLPWLQRVTIGGSACPEMLIRAFEENYRTEVIHGWGMTEMSPIGSLGTRKGGIEQLAGEAWRQLKLKQGRPMYTVDMCVKDDEGRVLAKDGKAFGHLVVRGPAVARSYHKGVGGEILDREGYFDTGDVATIDPHGYMQITDRAKDVIKSGGEWISSIDIENLAIGHPDVAEAAVIGIAHPKWDERPLLVVVRKPGRALAKDELLGFLKGKLAKWCMPDEVAFVDEIPHTATGKISKLALRERFKDFRLPAA